MLGPACACACACASQCGDEFELRQYERFSSLHLDPVGLPRGLADVQPGDCIIAFKKMDIFSTKVRKRQAPVGGAVPGHMARRVGSAHAIRSWGAHGPALWPDGVAPC